MKNTLNPLAAGLSMGLLCGAGFFVWTLIASQNGFGANALHMAEDFYPWYQVSVAGAFLGLIWGGIDGFIGGYLLVWLYNCFTKKLAN